MSCRNCKSNKIKVDDASGISVCLNCGLMNANQIVSEVAFAEISGGKTVVQGSSDICRLVFAVNLPEHYRDAAQRHYNLAVVHQFTRGRRNDIVAAACLYAVCRTDNSLHMLIDFADILQVDVFILGATFLKLCRVLIITLPLIDPSLYIYDFAAALDFGNYTQRVAQDAVRIAQRMDRDWITSGCRPSDISGACLLLAARINGFRKTTYEIAYVAKAADITIQERLKELNRTESTQLPVSNFKAVWLKNRAKTPSYQNKKGELSRALEAGGSENDHESKENEDTDVDDESEEEETLTLGKRKRKINDVSTAHSKRIHLNKKEETTTVKSKRDVNDASTTSSKRITLKKNEEPITRKRERDTSSQNKVSINKEDEVEKRPAKRNKGKAPDRSSRQNVYYVVPSSEDKLLSDDEVVGPFVGNQVDISEVENEELTLKQIEDSDIITIKDPAFKKLSIEEKKALASIVKAKIAEFLNPDLQENTKAIADEIEQWLGDESMNKAASEIKKAKHAGHKTGDDEEEEDDAKEEEDEEEEEDDAKEEEDDEEEGSDDDDEEEDDAKKEDDDAKEEGDKDKEEEDDSKEAEYDAKEDEDKEGSDDDDEEKFAERGEEEDEEDMGSDDTDDYEQFLRDIRGKHTVGDDEDDQFGYYEDEDEDF